MGRMKIRDYVVRITISALLIAIQIVLTHIVSLTIGGYLRFSFTFLPIAIGAMFYGPVWGGVMAAAADVIGFFLLSSSGQMFFPGYTLTAFATGAIFGMFLYKRPLTSRSTLMNIGISVLLTTLLCELLLNTLWLVITTGMAVKVILPARAIKAALGAALKFALMYPFMRYVMKPFRRFIPE